MLRRWRRMRSMTTLVSWRTRMLIGIWVPGTLHSKPPGFCSNIKSGIRQRVNDGTGSGPNWGSRCGPVASRSAQADQRLGSKPAQHASAPCGRGSDETGRHRHSGQRLRFRGRAWRAPRAGRRDPRHPKVRRPVRRLLCRRTRPRIASLVLCAQGGRGHVFRFSARKGRAANDFLAISDRGANRQVRLEAVDARNPVDTRVVRAVNQCA